MLSISVSTPWRLQTRQSITLFHPFLSFSSSSPLNLFAASDELLLFSLLFLFSADNQDSSSSSSPSLLRPSSSPPPQVVLSSSEKPWLCEGADGFVSTVCGACVANSQCFPGTFCCPYLKVCVASSSDSCRKPYALCHPPLPAERPEEIDYDQWRAQCIFADLDTWVTCPPSADFLAKRY